MLKKTAIYLTTGLSLLNLLTGCASNPVGPVVPAHTNAVPQFLIPPAPQVFTSEVMQMAVAPTNGQVICGTNRFGHPFCYTNGTPRPPQPTGLTLGWTQTATNPAVFGTFSNTLLWSTNAPNGPWTGTVPILCTNSNMEATVTFDLKVPQMFFKLGSNVP